MPPSPTANPNPAGSTYSDRVLMAARWGTLCILVIAAVVVRLQCLACKPFWFDEGFSVEIAWIDWRNFLHLMWWREANMSLYYVLLRVWLHWGQSPFFVRSLSVLISAATVPAVYWVAQALYDRRVGIIAAALFTFNAYSVRYSQEARSYSLFLLMATLSSGFMVAWLQHPTRRNRVGYILASSLAVYAHFYALLLVAAHWLAVVPTGALQITDQAELRTREIRRAWITIGIAVSPLIVFVAKTGAGPIKWIPRPGIHDLFTLFEHLASGTSWLLLAIVLGASIVAVAACGTALLMPARGWEIWRCQFLLIWLLFPIVLTAVLSFARPVFLARYMIFCLPALLILAAVGLARLKPWCFSVAVLIVALFLCMRGTSYVYGHDFDQERDASGAASNFILDHSEPGDAIVFHIAGTRVPYEFFRSLRAGENTASPTYGGGLGPEIIFPRHGPGLECADFTGKPTEEFLRNAALTHKRLWVMLMNNGSAQNPDPTTVMLSRVLPESLPRMQSWRFHLVEVRLYSRQ
jgi:hypothetical protein